ncbi:MAG TPA: TrkA C-terminal domain-containing protein, partial [Bdellovibrionota bacterium]|nr:TrkA C-terminal domain-containing protein [Bdellovibrionota bacterium]
AIWAHRWAILGITILHMAGKATFATVGTLIAGQRLQTSILVGFSLAQIGEFSFIIATLGLGLGLMSPHLYPVAVAVSLITTFSTPYFIRHSITLARWLERRMPERAAAALEKYAVWRERQSVQSARGPDFDRRALRWMLSGFVVTAVNVIVASYALPRLVDYFDSAAWAYTASWTIATLVSAPFIWSMAFAFHGYKGRSGATPVLAQILAVLWIGILSLAFFPARYVGIATLLIGGFLFTRLYHRLEASYRWFESAFLDTFQERGKSKKPIDLFRHLAPWDEHLVRLKVHTNSEVAGKRLQDVELRKKYGLNIVAIQRGGRAIVAPKPDQQIFPKDELLALGTDEQIEQVRPLVESSTAGPASEVTIEGYELRPFFVTATSHLKGRTIRDSRLREEFSVMVVGLERADRRIMNPDTDLAISEGDTLWVVGESPALDALQQRVGSREP